MSKKIQYIVVTVIAVAVFLWIERLTGLLLLGLLCLAVPFIRKRFALYSIDDVDARLAAVPRLAKVAIAAVIGAYIGNFLGRTFLLGTSLATVLTAAAFGALAWYLSGPAKTKNL